MSSNQQKQNNSKARVDDTLCNCTPVPPSKTTQKEGYKLIEIGDFFFIKVESTGDRKCVYDFEKGEYFKATPENRVILEKRLEEHPYIDPETGRIADYWCCQPIEL